MKKYRGYFNYHLKGVLKTWHFRHTLLWKIEAWREQFKNPNVYTYVGLKLNTEDSDE